MRLDSPHHQRKRALFGIAVIGVGILALLDNMQLFGFPLLRTLWPLVFVLFGLSRLLWPRHSGSWLFGLALIGVGTAMTMQKLGWLSLNFHSWWPVFIILGGVAILMRAFQPRRERFGRRFVSSAGLEHGDVVEIEATFSAIKLQNDSRSFKGGKIDALFGGVELDLTQAVIEGEATLQISATFSGVELRVPREWQVVTQISPTLGGVNDKTVPPMNPTQRLILRGDTVFGGVEIKN